TVSQTSGVARPWRQSSDSIASYVPVIDDVTHGFFASNLATRDNLRSHTNSAKKLGSCRPSAGRGTGTYVKSDENWKLRCFWRSLPVHDWLSGDQARNN
ncbi:MAG: hypothetical protein M3Y22_09505, partial [Pseudomonadota bacterium]|nr:hypothetical protein [Pseudomonadota bacterium]